MDALTLDAIPGGHGCFSSLGVGVRVTDGLTNGWCLGASFFSELGWALATANIINHILSLCLFVNLSIPTENSVLQTVNKRKTGKHRSSFMLASRYYQLR